MLTWFQRQKTAGELLLSMGKTSQIKLLFWIGICELALAAIMTLLFIVKAGGFIPYDINLFVEAARLIFFWSLAIFFFMLVLNKLQLRSNGICYLLKFMAWQRINSSTWEGSKASMLTIWLKPKFSLLLGFMSIVIPSQEMETVNSILVERLGSQ